MKKFNDFNKLNEEITYEQLGLKSPTYEDNVRNYVINIIMEENGVSEKSFKQINKITEEVKFIFNEWSDIKKDIELFKNKKLRIKFCAEYLYDKYNEELELSKYKI